MALTRIDHVADDARVAGCIDDCVAAVQACEWCATECTEMGRVEMATCIQLCRDVADVTGLHARFLARNSAFESDLAEVCADLCEACATECAQFEAGHCQICADVLRDCASSCREMAAA